MNEREYFLRILNIYIVFYVCIIYGGIDEGDKI